MRDHHKDLINIILSLGIVALSVFIVHRFIPSLVWAGIIVIATYPLYQRWHRLFGQYHNASALLFTIVLAGLLLLPLSWLISILLKEMQLFINYLQLLNREGGAAPELFTKLPVIGKEIERYWNSNISQPGNIKQWLSGLHLSLTPASYYLKQIGINVAHRSFQLGFTLLTLFFFYRDGDKLFQQINQIGQACLGERWFRYAVQLPSALRSTVNGTIFVGLGVGILMGLCYVGVGFPAPTLTGFITAFAAMIPFVVPLVFTIVALVLFAKSYLIGAIVVIVWGTVVMFVADHFIKPILIGGAIRLPFLAVLFSILGGVETLGLLGLFLGPIIMVLFITLWQEPQVAVKKNLAKR